MAVLAPECSNETTLVPTQAGHSKRKHATPELYKRNVNGKEKLGVGKG